MDRGRGGWSLKSELDNGRLLVVVDDPAIRERLIVDPFESADAGLQRQTERITDVADQNLHLSPTAIAEIEGHSLALLMIEAGDMPGFRRTLDGLKATLGVNLTRFDARHAGPSQPAKSTSFRPSRTPTLSASTAHQWTLIPRIDIFLDLKTRVDGNFGGEDIERLFVACRVTPRNHRQGAT